MALLNSVAILLQHAGRDSVKYDVNEIMGLAANIKDNRNQMWINNNVVNTESKTALSTSFLNST